MKKSVRNLGIIVLFILVVVAGCSPGAEEQASGSPVNLTFASWGMGSGWYSYAATMADLLRQELPPGSAVDVLPYAGALGNPSLISEGEADLGLAMNVTGHWAAKGQVSYDEPLENLRGLVGGLDRYYMAIIVREDLGVASLEEIVEQEIPIRLVTVPQGGAGELATRLILEAYGTDYETIKGWGGNVNHNAFDVIVSDMKDGRVDVFIHMITPGHPSVTEIATTVRVDFLPLREEVREELVRDYGFEFAALPPGTFRGQELEVETLGLRTALITGADLDEELAYQITKTVVEGKETLARSHAGLQDFRPGEAWKPELVGLPLHPGAERYFQEEGLM